VAWVTEIYPALGTITFTDWNNPLPYHTATHTISLAAWPGLQYIYANP
jgi:surface antigen